MKVEKQRYLKTLLNGEQNGHCRGISQRIDPTKKYKLQQQIAKHKIQ